MQNAYCDGTDSETNKSTSVRNVSGLLMTLAIENEPKGWELNPPTPYPELNHLLYDWSNLYRHGLSGCAIWAENMFL